MNLSYVYFCRGNTPETRGTAYVVYEDIFDAKNACDHLSGFNVCNRYLVVLYYNANRVSTAESRHRAVSSRRACAGWGRHLRPLVVGWWNACSCGSGPVT